MSTIEATLFLALRTTDRHPYMAARITPKTPKLAAGEVVVELKLKVPRALFQRPTLRASVEIPAGQVPTMITADVQDNIARALSEQLGMRVEITVPEGI